MSGNLEGQLIIGLVRGPEGLKVTIDSSRPVMATSRLFNGRRIDEVTGMVPMLFSVCAIAQSVAAVEACEQAAGISPQCRQQQLRQMLVDFETAKEHLWRILLDWPLFCDEQAEAGAMAEPLATLKDFRSVLNPAGVMRAGEPLAEDRAPLMAAIGRLESVVETQVLGESCASWFEIDDLERLSAWAGQQESCAARMIDLILRQGWAEMGRARFSPLPVLEAEQARQLLTSEKAERFIAKPQLDGQCYETNSLVRMQRHPLIAAISEEYGYGLLARFVARLLELASIPRSLAERAEGSGQMQQQESAQLPDGEGIALVEAARGRLLHRVVLEGERIAQYQVVAPTEWNFHPQGVLAQSLVGLAWSDQARLSRQAGLMVQAIDPCVGYQVGFD